MEYNIYCDESCHLEHDGSNIMVIGGVWCQKSEKDKAFKRLRELKVKYGLKPTNELKWNAVSKSKIDYYKDVLNYFFDNESLHFRALVVPNKMSLNHEAYQQTHDQFYYKTQYIDKVYQVFKHDFIDNKPHVEDLVFKLKFNPMYQDKAYTFYHMTHEGHDEANRTPDLRRCERMPWCKPGIEKAEIFSLKFWEEERKGKNRICIWLEVNDIETENRWNNNYFIVLDVRDKFVLPWTAFCADYHHQIIKKQKEYFNWKKSIGNKEFTLYSLAVDIMSRKKQGSPE